MEEPLPTLTVSNLKVIGESEGMLEKNASKFLREEG